MWALHEAQSMQYDLILATVSTVGIIHGIEAEAGDQRWRVTQVTQVVRDRTGILF